MPVGSYDLCFLTTESIGFVRLIRTHFSKARQEYETTYAGSGRWPPPACFRRPKGAFSNGGRVFRCQYLATFPAFWKLNQLDLSVLIRFVFETARGKYEKAVFGCLKHTLVAPSAAASVCCLIFLMCCTKNISDQNGQI